MLYLSKVHLENIRCFERLELDIGTREESVGWTIVVGDNATGKSALLKSIAIGLCDPASAAGLITESTEGYIRRGEDTASITLTFCDRGADSGRGQKRECSIKTSFSRLECDDGSTYESVTQSTVPEPAAFPWKRLFVSGYGAGRGMAGTGDLSGYTPIDAVYNMFNYAEGLQNPELVVHRLKERGIEERPILADIAEFLDIDALRLETKGMLADGPWGEGMPMRDLADGYRSSFSWVADLIGWALAFRPDLKTTNGIRGIVLVDEIEAHLHARWQRRVIADLRRLFPNVQFIATTHSALVASSIGATAADQLIVLELENGTVTQHAHEHMLGWRMDQVLASRAFKYQISADPEFQAVLRRGSELASIEDRTPEQDAQYERIKNLLRNSVFNASSPIGRAAELEARTDRRDEIRELEKELSEDIDQ